MPDIATTELTHETETSSTTQVLVHTSVFFGAAGTGLTPFLFDQATPLLVWTINHNLGYKPMCELRDLGGNVYGADVSNPNLTQTIVTHSAPTAGSARLI